MPGGTNFLLSMLVSQLLADVHGVWMDFSYRYPFQSLKVEAKSNLKEVGTVTLNRDINSGYRLLIRIKVSDELLLFL